MKQPNTSHCEAVRPLHQVIAAKQTPTGISERGQAFGMALVDRLQQALYDPEYVRHENGRDGKTITPQSYAGSLSLLLADCTVGHGNMPGQDEGPLPQILQLQLDDGSVSEKFRSVDLAIKLNSLAASAIAWSQEAYGEEFAADVHTFFPDAGVPVVTPKPAESANS